MEEKTDLKNVFRVYFHGNFIPLQGVEYIIRAAKILLSHKDVQIKIIGAGFGYDRIRALADELGVNNVNFLGKIPLEQLPEHLLKADICLGIFGDTAKTQRVIPNKVYESIAMAKPVISADTPAMREIFADRENILFCRHADPQDLAAKILELKNDKELREKIAKGGRELFKLKASPKIIAKQLMDNLGGIKNKIVIYTAIFGGKDKLTELKFIPKGCDFVCFTDSDLESRAWQIKKMKPVHEDPVRSAKVYKILPHKFFLEYEYSVWVDGNFFIRGDVKELINKYLKECNFAAFDHKQNKHDPRDCIYEEAEALIEMAGREKYKDDPELIKRQVEKYRQEGYPENNGLTTNMILVRRHNEPDIIKVMEDWWKEIKENSRRDQLSFNYVAWKNKLKFVYMDGDSRDNKYFLWVPHRDNRSFIARLKSIWNQK